MRYILRNILLAGPILAAWLILPGPGLGAPAMKRSDPAIQKRIEAELPRQGDLIRAAAQGLEAHRPGVRDVYFLGIAGWGDQDVFRLEVEKARALFDSRFGTAGRSLLLLNHPETLGERPLATRETIETAIDAMTQKLDPEEDVLVLFISTHGAQWDGVSLVLDGRNFGRLMPAQLARMLGMARLRNRVVIVSACFSGQFVPALAEEHTLLITAAASDRASFGCALGNDWTWFGEAFFAQALPKAGALVPAFKEAVKRVTAKEKREKMKPSVPQIRVGAKIRPVLSEAGL